MSTASTGERRDSVVVDDFVRPNGIAFSPDESKLYVADSAAASRDGPKHIRVFDVGANGTLTGGEVFADCTAGRFDGFRFDARAGSGPRRRRRALLRSRWHVDRQGEDPEICSNVVFGGPKRNVLFVTATNSLYAVMLHVNGHRTF